MNTASAIHYYPIGRAVGFLFLGSLLLGFTTLMMANGVRSVWFVLAWILGLAAIGLGLRALTTRKKYPMRMEPAHLTFYRNGKEVRVEVQQIRRVWYNRSGVDARVSLALADGNVIDIPVLYGLDELRKRIQTRYGLPTE